MADIEPGLLTNTQTFYAPALKHTVKPALVANAQTFFAPTITQEALPASVFSRGRRLAYTPILDNAIRAREPMRLRRKTLPGLFTEGRRALRLTSKTDRGKVNTASYGAQTAYEQAPGETGGAPPLVPILNRPDE